MALTGLWFWRKLWKGDFSRCPLGHGEKIGLGETTPTRWLQQRRFTGRWGRGGQGCLKVALLSSQGSGSAAYINDSAGAGVSAGGAEALRSGRWGELSGNPGRMGNTKVPWCHSSDQDVVAGIQCLFPSTEMVHTSFNIFGNSPISHAVPQSKAEPDQPSSSAPSTNAPRHSVQYVVEPLKRCSARLCGDVWPIRKRKTPAKSGRHAGSVGRQRRNGSGGHGGPDQQQRSGPSDKDPEHSVHSMLAGT